VSKEAYLHPYLVSRQVTYAPFTVRYTFFCHTPSTPSSQHL
jgi:hypothetical protein